MSLRYRDFVDEIDVDAFEADIGFNLIRQDKGKDIGHCLFPENHSHGDTTGKFAIWRETKTYNCFVCGGGDFVSLLVQLYGWDSSEAVRFLYKYTTGTDTRSDIEFENDFLAQLADDVEERVKLPYFNEHALDQFDGPVDYFRTRGISDEIINEYGLCTHSSLMRPAPKGEDDYFGPAAIFPHRWNERLVGWQTRWLDYPEVPKWLPKYTNTSSFPKKQTIFNYDQVLKTKESVVVVESIPTVLLLASYGIPSVGFFGSKPTDPQLRLLRRFSQGVILAPDNDKTGDQFVRRAGEYLDRFVPVWIGEKVGKRKDDIGVFAQHDNPQKSLLFYLQNCIKPYWLDL